MISRDDYFKVLYVQIVKCKLPGSTTVLRTHSKHGRYIVDEAEDTIVKCAYGTAVSASALVSFMSRASATIYEVVRFFSMIDVAMSSLRRSVILALLQ